MNQVYQNGNFKIYHSKNGYIVHNSEMKNFAHSHIKNFSACKMLISLSLMKKVPNNLNEYFLISLLKINDNKEYSQKIKELLLSRSNKKKKNIIVLRKEE
ncbi:MAG: hypothetical protein RR255_00210 [Bacilli bacterium]